MSFISLLTRDINKYDGFIKEYKINPYNQNHPEIEFIFKEKGGDKKFALEGYSGKIYNLLADTNIQLNGRFDGPTIRTDKIVETGLYISAYSRSNTITFNTEGIAEVDGNPISENCLIFLVDGSFVVLREQELCIITAKGYTITQKLIQDDSIKVEIKTAVFGISDDSLAPGGLIGITLNEFFTPQLYSEDEIDTYLKIYEVISLLPPIPWKIIPAA